MAMSGGEGQVELHRADVGVGPAESIWPDCTRS